MPAHAIVRRLDQPRLVGGLPRAAVVQPPRLVLAVANGKVSTDDAAAAAANAVLVDAVLLTLSLPAQKKRTKVWAAVEVLRDVVENAVFPCFAKKKTFCSTKKKWP